MGIKETKVEMKERRKVGKINKELRKKINDERREKE